MSGLTAVLLMGAQRGDGMPLQGLRMAFGGSLFLTLGTLIVGIAMLVMSIVILVKVANMEKMIRREQPGEMKKENP